ncbi:MAG: alpha/beta hydrolase [Bacteroidales bacterium]|nr:alpha/beta hydrolase [Bacteroidales bacterium]
MKQVWHFLLVLCLFYNFNITQTFAGKGEHSDSVQNISNGEFITRINGLKLWYKVSGNGPVCIMPSEGWGPGSDIYSESLKELEKIFTMVYLDTRGSGRSEDPEMEQYTLANFVSDIEGIRKHLGVKKTWLMGHSRAGVLILEYALTYPDKTNGIILINSAVGYILPPQELKRRVMAKEDEPWYQEATSYIGKKPENAEDLNKGMQKVMPFYFHSTANYEKNRELLKQQKLSFHAYLGQQNWWNADREVSSRLSEIETPVLIVVGINDFICSLDAAQYLHLELPGSKLLAIENAGHFPWLEQSYKFYKGIEKFLPKLGYKSTE